MRRRDDRLRVLQVVDTLGVGGIERWLLQIAEAIDRRRVDLDVLVHGRDPGALERAVAATGSRILRCPRPTRPLAWARAFHRHLNAGSYDVVHAHPYRFCGPILHVARRVGVPLRIAHSRNALPPPSITWPPAWLAHRAARSLILHEMTLGLAVSSTAAAALFGKRWREDARIQLFPSAIDMDSIRCLPREIVTRERLDIAQGALVVGHVAGFRPAKNHTKVVATFAALHKRVPESVLVLVGDGPLRPRIMREVEASGLSSAVRWLGWQDNIPALLDRLCDVCVLPSRWEGLPRVVAEAIGVGLPVVISQHLAPELDYLPGRVLRVPLQAPSTEWCAAVLDAAALGRIDHASGIEAIITAGLDMAQQAPGLVDLYFDTLSV